MYATYLQHGLLSDSLEIEFESQQLCVVIHIKLGNICWSISPLNIILHDQLDLEAFKLHWKYINITVRT